MPRIPRSLLFDPAEPGIYHCVNRCVRRAFLCGVDRMTGKNFDHRKEWIQGRLEYLAGQMGLDVLGFAVMSNHLHVVLRNRPDVVERWSDDEVARRWWNLFPSRRNDDDTPAEPNASDLAMITGNAARLAEVRRRLSSLSWFMRCLAEPIARRANGEDSCTGRFWEGRFKAQPVLDEPALAACLAYVDLNPVRARIAATPEESRFTSVYERVQALSAEERNVPCDPPPEAEDWGGLPEADTVHADSAYAVTNPAVTNPDGNAPAQVPMVDAGRQVRTHAAAGSVRLELPREMSAANTARDEPREERCDTPGVRQQAGDSPRKGTRHGMGHGIGQSARPAAEWLSPFELSAEQGLNAAPAARASNKGCLAMTFTEYLQLLDWTGRQLRQEKRGAIPADLAPILERLSVTDDGWLKLVTEFSRIFRRSAGTPASLGQDARKWGRKRREGISQSRAAFASPA